MSACGAFLFALLMPAIAAASPAETVASRFIDVLLRDDFSALAALTGDSAPSGWKDLRELISYFDCISVLRYDWTVVSETSERIELRVEVHGTAELKGDSRPVKVLPKIWHIEAKRTGSEWIVAGAMTEERRVARAMLAAPDEDAAECDLLQSTSVDPRDVLPVYAYMLEFSKIPRRIQRHEHAQDLARRTADATTEIVVSRRRLHELARFDTPRAYELGRQIEAIARAHGIPDDVAGTLLTIGIAQLYANDLEDALGTYAACAAMAEELDDPTISIKCAQMIVVTQGARDPQAALHALDRIDHLTRRYRWEEGLELVHFGRANIHLELGNVDLARAETRELVRLGERHGNGQTVHYAMLNLANIELAEQHYHEAVAWFRKARARFGGRSLTEGYIPALRGIGELAEAESIVRKLEARTPGPGTSRASPRAEEETTLALPASAKSLAAIEYVVAEKQVVAFVITRAEDGSSVVRAERLPIAKEELAREAREVAELAAARSPAYRTAAARLHAALLAPLERHLRGAMTLAIIPDGVLWTVPFHALVTPDGAAVIDRRAVFYAHSLALLSGPAAKRTARSRLLAFGNPTVGAGPRAKLRAATPGLRLGPLVEAEEEVRSLASMYPERATRLYFGDEAREAVFKAEAPEYGILHIAAHAIVDDRAPMYSAIVLAPSGQDTDDGLLEAREVVDLALNAELAVLSACETARGEVNAGEGMIGLPWAFFVAGCPTTIVSQWKAESAATAALMVELHTRLRAGDTVAEALRRAQLSVRRQRAYGHPFYWAPFVAIGAAAQAPAIRE